MNMVVAGLENEDWKLSLQPKWQQKREAVYEPCKRCNGEGSWRPGFGNSFPEDDPNYNPSTGRITCNSCWGQKTKMVDPGYKVGPPRQLPEDFLTHMRKALAEYCRMKEEAANELQEVLNKY